jgi:hypothetical protein
MDLGQKIELPYLPSYSVDRSTDRPDCISPGRGQQIVTLDLDEESHNYVKAQYGGTAVLPTSSGADTHVSARNECRFPNQYVSGEPAMRTEVAEISPICFLYPGPDPVTLTDSKALFIFGVLAVQGNLFPHFDFKRDLWGKWGVRLQFSGYILDQPSYHDKAISAKAQACRGALQTLKSQFPHWRIPHEPGDSGGMSSYKWTEVLDGMYFTKSSNKKFWINGFLQPFASRTAWVCQSTSNIHTTWVIVTKFRFTVSRRLETNFSILQRTKLSKLLLINACGCY